MRRILVGIPVFLAVLCSTAPTQASLTDSVPRRLEEVTVAVPTPSVRHGDRNLYVAEIQQALTRGGWPTVDDGYFGDDTLRTVVAFQRANGLVADGIVGQATRRALGLPQRFGGDATSAVAVPTGPKPAVRLHPPAPQPAVYASNCDEMSAYRQAAGLPDIFDAIGKRESDCRNEDGVRTFCCYGWWQNYISSHLSSNSAYRDRIINECGVTGADDINSDTPDDKRRQACVTFVVWSISGMTPWATG